MIWFRKPHRASDHADLDQRVEEAEAQRDESEVIRAESEASGEKFRRHIEDNNFGKRFKAAFEARRGTEPQS